MRPIMISPCAGCGVMLEHDHDPRTVLCGGCARDRYPQYSTMKHLVPPPTTEQREKRLPPPTVEWIRPSKAEHRVLKVLCWMGLAAFWFAMGFFVRGGA